ncbi:MAG: hypothetical protein GX465_17430 [Acidobacteria bacterium]|nr:hypothetical protein [Acidobacteriota bacterium]
MQAIVKRAEEDVQRAIAHARQCADGTSPKPLARVEGELWTAMLALGRAFLVLFLVQRAAALRPTSYQVGGVSYLLDTKNRRHGSIGTRFGKVPFSRPVGRSMLGCGPADLPVDRELGLSSGFSLGTVTAIVRLSATLAFATARATFREFHEWMPSPRAVLRMVDAVGGKARAFLDVATVPEDDGEVLVIQVDGRGAPMITATERDRRARPHGQREGTERHRRRDRRRAHPRPRRQQGDKSKNAKVAFVGVLYTLRRTSKGVEGPINKRLIATFESHDALFRWLREHADRRGYGRKRTLFLADGSEHIWRCQAQYFPDAEPCLDWYHVVEKLWEAGACIHDAGSDELKAWMARQTARLRRGQVTALLGELRAQHRAIPKTGPGNKGRRERLAKVTKYLADHAHRMPYARLRRDDLDIGTGAVEGAVRNLVGLRLDGPGMRWGRERSELVMHLRCILLNGQWDEFRQFLSRSQLKLAPQPAAARPHDAVRQEAA